MVVKLGLLELLLNSKFDFKLEINESIAEIVCDDFYIYYKAKGTSCITKNIVPKWGIL